MVNEIDFTKGRLLEPSPLSHSPPSWALCLSWAPSPTCSSYRAAHLTHSSRLAGPIERCLLVWARVAWAPAYGGCKPPHVIRNVHQVTPRSPERRYPCLKWSHDLWTQLLELKKTIRLPCFSIWQQDNSRKVLLPGQRLPLPCLRP